jgi:GNAT superfamily N-acetyltransferase
VTSAVEVVEIAAADTHALRLAVLRFDTPTKEVVFPEDELPGSWHLGARLGEHAVQLRGMATARHLQGSGLGGVLLERGCEVAAERGFPVVWARARDAALAFYERHGFEVIGDGFVDQATQLPHHLVVRRLG